MRTGLYENIPDWKYHDGTDGHLSSSQLKDMLKNPSLFKAKLDGFQKFDSTALKFGRAAHTLILENEKFDDQYMVFDDSADMRKKENKQMKKETEQLAKEKNMEVITLSDWEKLQTMRGNILSYAPAAELLCEDGVTEVSGYYQDSGINLKIRPDYLTKSNKIIDLKTSRDASLSSFTRDFKWNFHYDLSAAMYIDGMKKITGEDFEYYFIVVEKEAPFSVAVYKLSDESRRLGDIKYKEAMTKVALCRDTKSYQLQNRIQEI